MERCGGSASAAAGPAARPALDRALRLPHATAMVVGTIIGASIFVQPAEITARVPSVEGIVLVWLVSGVLTLFGALVCAELASTFARSGGVYVYLTEAFSPHRRRCRGRPSSRLRAPTWRSRPAPWRWPAW